MELNGLDLLYKVLGQYSHAAVVSQLCSFDIQFLNTCASEACREGSDCNECLYSRIVKLLVVYSPDRGPVFLDTVRYSGCGKNLLSMSRVWLPEIDPADPLLEEKASMDYSARVVRHVSYTGRK